MRSERWIALGVVVCALAVADTASAGSRAGDLDRRYADDGVLVSKVDGIEYPDTSAIGPDGSSVVVGKGFAGGSSNLLIARYRPDGERDTDFAGDGRAELRAPEGVAWYGPVFAEIDPNGNIILLGTQDLNPEIGEHGIDLVPHVFRLTDDGNLDEAFGDEGVWATPSACCFQMGRGLSEEGGSVYVLLAGLIRIAPDGTTDEAFAGDGVAEDPPI